MPTWGQRFQAATQQRQPAQSLTWRDLVRRVQQAAATTNAVSRIGLAATGNSAISQRAGLTTPQSSTAWARNLAGNMQDQQRRAWQNVAAAVQTPQRRQAPQTQQAPQNWRNWGQAGSGLATTPPPQPRNAQPSANRTGLYYGPFQNEVNGNPYPDTAPAGGIGNGGGYGSDPGSGGSYSGALDASRWWLDMMSWRI